MVFVLFFRSVLIASFGEEFELAMQLILKMKKKKIKNTNGFNGFLERDSSSKLRAFDDFLR